jgi:hypothetical protein
LELPQHAKVVGQAAHSLADVLAAEIFDREENAEYD